MNRTILAFLLLQTAACLVEASVSGSYHAKNAACPRKSSVGLMKMKIVVIQTARDVLNRIFRSFMLK